jgi:hypothetical protein
MEIKVTQAGEIIPIEINPMCFAACCASDITKYAWGFNVYEYFMTQKHPDWETIIEKSNKDTMYYVSFVDIPEGFPKSTVREFNFGAYLARFSNVFEVRRVNFKSNPFFGIILGSTDNKNELGMILKLEPAQFAN